jgi:hypothetical protein
LAKGHKKKYRYNAIMGEGGMKDSIVRWRSQGYSEEGIARLMGVSYECLRMWKREVSEFAELLKEGTVILHDKLQTTIYQKALGEIKVTKKERTIKKVCGKVAARTIKITTEEIPPDSALLVRSMVNLGKWKDRSAEVISENNNKAAIFVDDLNDLSEEELMFLEEDGIYDDEDI